MVLHLQPAPISTSFFLGLSPVVWNRSSKLTLVSFASNFVSHKLLWPLWWDLRGSLMSKDLDLVCYGSILGYCSFLSCEEEKVTRADFVPSIIKNEHIGGGEKIVGSRDWQLEDAPGVLMCSEPDTSWVTAAALAAAIFGAQLETFPRGLSWEGPGKSSANIPSFALLLH